MARRGDTDGPGSTSGINPGITPTYLRERAAHYLKLADTEEIRAIAADLRKVARLFEREAEALESDPLQPFRTEKPRR